MDVVVSYPTESGDVPAVDAQFMLCAMYVAMRDAEKSLTQVTRVTEIDPTFAAAYNLLGYRAMSEDDTAEAAFKKYIELCPNQANPHDSYAEFLMKQGRFTEAVSSYRTAYSLDNRYVSAKARAGVALALAGDADAAQALHELKAMKAFANRDRKKTVEHMSQAGDAPHVNDYLGQMYLEEGNGELGRQHLDRAAMANERTRSFALVRNRALCAMEHVN